MPPYPKKPIGKIALAAAVGIIAIVTILLVVQPFSSNQTQTTAPLVENTPPKKDDNLIEGSVVSENKSKKDSSNSSSYYTSSSDNVSVPDTYNDSSVSSDTNSTEDIAVTNTEVVVEDESPPPAPEIISGPKGNTQKTSASFQIKGESGSSFRCSLNRQNFNDARSCSGPKKYKNLSAGRQYVFRVWQVDKFGQRSYNPAVRKFYVKTRPLPPPRLISYPARWTNESQYLFEFSGKVGVQFSCSLNDSYFKNSLPCSSPAAYADLADGRYVFRVWQYKAGAVSKSPRKYVFNVDRTAPASPTITSGPEGSVVGADQAFTFEGEPGARFSCALSGASPDTCSSPKAYTGLSGAYTFSVWQTDRAGNSSLSPSERSFSVSPAPTSISAKSAQISTRGYQAETLSSGSVIAQQTEEDSNVTLDVLAAIELATPADDSDKVAPSGSSNINKGFSTSANLRSNLDWSVQTTLSNNELQGGTTGSRGLIAALDLSGSSDQGDRNASNAAQTYQANYNQDVSWGDEAGTYTVIATHTATQSLTDDN